MGIYLTHDSSELVFGIGEFGSTYLEELKLSKRKYGSEQTASQKQVKSIQQNFFSEQLYSENQVFEFDLNSSDEEVQAYEENNDNLIHLFVKRSNGEFISGSDCIVQIALDVEGAMGLGIELIIKAMRMKALGQKESTEVERLEPIGSNGGSSESLGVYLTHDSCALEFTVKNLGTYPEQVKLAEQAWKAQGGT